MDLVTYYSKRAAEYESIYSKPERQADLRQLQELLRTDLAARDVLEIACGTGYWAERIASVADSITALDISDSVLEVARSKKIVNSKVQFSRADNYALHRFNKGFSGGLAGFWWSHVPKERQRQFMAGFLPHFSPGAVICFFDNRYVEGSSTPISRCDLAGNTYQVRKLADGSQSEVLKNFFTRAELISSFAQTNLKCEVLELTYFWYVRLSDLAGGVGTPRSP